MQFKKKKLTKYRGSKTHGGGSMKKRRGAGNRGGRGNAGSGKRGDANRQRFQKAGVIPGKHGFKCHSGRNTVKAINLKDIVVLLPAWTKGGKSDGTELNLTKLGYDKLLGSGAFPLKLTITVSVATAKAVDKVKASGGAVNLPKSNQPAEE